MKKNQTRLVQGNTEIIISDFSEKNIEEKEKVAIRIDRGVYNYIMTHYGERGFSKFYDKAAKDLIEKETKKK